MSARPGAEGYLLPRVPVDFRRWRRESCASPPALTPPPPGTASRSAPQALRRSLGCIEVSYWPHRPDARLERGVRRASQADVDAASATHLLLADDPNLVQLEALPGRNPG